MENTTFNGLYIFLWIYDKINMFFQVLQTNYLFGIAWIWWFVALMIVDEVFLIIATLLHRQYGGVTTGNSDNIQRNSKQSKVNLTKK